MKHFLLIISMLAILCGAMCGCSNDTCSQNRSTLPLAGFYNEEMKKINVDSLLIYGIGGTEDSTIVAEPGTGLSRVYLPMRPGSDETTWVISYKQHNLDFPALNDTMTLRYTSSPYFASSECGVVMHYRLNSLNYTRHLIDSIAVTDSVFNNYDYERIKIIFRTSESEPDEPGDESNSEA